MAIFLILTFQKNLQNLFLNPAGRARTALVGNSAKQGRPIRTPCIFFIKCIWDVPSANLALRRWLGLAKYRERLSH